MSVLLPRDTIMWERPSRTLDGHGWALTESATDMGDIQGSVQEDTADSDPTAGEGGGSGPASPTSRRSAVAYLDAHVLPGDVLTCNDVRWRVGPVWWVDDPRGPGGPLGCWLANLTEDVLPDEDGS